MQLQEGVLGFCSNRGDQGDTNNPTDIIEVQFDQHRDNEEMILCLAAGVTIDKIVAWSSDPFRNELGQWMQTFCVKAQMSNGQNFFISEEFESDGFGSQVVRAKLAA